jgi:hypothetical protein
MLLKWLDKVGINICFGNRTLEQLLKQRYELARGAGETLFEKHQFIERNG